MQNTGPEKHLWSHQPERYVVTAEHAADWIMAGDNEQQAALLIEMAKKVDDWEVNQSWSIQCRGIAESMTDDECHQVRSMLAELVEYLEAIPAERRVKRATNVICDAVAKAVSE